MKTRIITQEVTFSASPREVYEALMDPAKHSAFTGAPAEIEKKPGGKFVQNNGGHWGALIEFEQDKRIDQSWHARNWPEGHYSVVAVTLAPLAAGRRTQLSLVHTGVPEDHFDEVSNGWQKFYWTKMAAYFRNEKAVVVRRFVEEVVNQGNLDIVNELFTPGFVLHRAGSTLLPIGPAGPKEIGRALVAAFSERCVAVEDTIVEDDRVVERHAISAVHTGTFNNVPATGRKVCWTENNIYRIQDNRIAEAWTETSLHDLMAQITFKQAKAA